MIYNYDIRAYKKSHFVGNEMSNKEQYSPNRSVKSRVEYDIVSEYPYAILVSTQKGDEDNED